MGILSVALLPLLLFLGCASHQAEPRWFVGHELVESESYQVIGYGKGASYKEAKSNALEDIALKIETKVHSSFSSEQASSQNNFTKNLNQSLLLQSDVTLNRVKELTSTNVNGVVYLALMYEDVPLEKRILDAVGEIQYDENIQNSYLKKTPLFISLAQSNLAKNFLLHRQDGRWYLKYRSKTIALDERHFSQLFTSVKDSELILSLGGKARELLEGDSFFFKIESQKSGYLSLFSVYEDGTVSLFSENQNINRKLSLPDQESSRYFEAGVIEAGKDTIDLYVAVLSSDMLNSEQFCKADALLISDERCKNFDTLLQYLEDKIFTSLVVRTKAKH